MNRNFKISAFVITAVFSIALASCSDDDNNGSGSASGINTNKNIATPGYAEVSRLEFPKIKGGKSIILKYYSGDTYGLNYCVE